MKDFEKKLSDFFNEKTSTSEVDADRLWENIEATLPEKKKRKRPIFFWLFGLLLVGGAVAYFYSSTMNIKEGEKVQTAAKKQDIAATEGTNLITEKTTSTSVTVPAGKKQEGKEEMGLEKGKKTIVKDNKNISKITQETTFTNLKGEANQPTQNSFPQKNKVKENKDQILPEIDADSIFETPSVLINKTENSLQEPFAISEKLPTIPLMELQAQSDIFLDILIKKQEKNKSSRWKIGVFYGVNLWQNQFKDSSETSNLQQDLQEANTLKWGNSLLTEVQFKLRKNLYLKCGLEYVAAQTEFNIVRSKDSTAVINNLPVSGISTRTVRHYNRQQYFGIPLSVGLLQQRGVWYWGADAGLSFNYVLKQSGKSLNATNNIAVYDEANAAFQPFFISYHLRPFVGYQISKNILLQIRPDLRFQTHGESDFFGLRHSSFVYSGSLGVVFSL